jgi:hypothetical protein
MRLQYHLQRNIIKSSSLPSPGAIYTQIITMATTHTPSHERIEDWFKAFYAISDDGTAHETYPEFFAADAKLIMGDKTAVGREGMFQFPQFPGPPIRFLSFFLSSSSAFNPKWPFLAPGSHT